MTVQITIYDSGQSIKNLLLEAGQKLHAYDSARLDAEILMCEVMQIERSHIYSQPELRVPTAKICIFNSLVNARQAGYPVAYLIGQKEFWSLDLQVNMHTFIPRPETECLIESVLSRVPVEYECNIADLGTGSGAIALAIASERPDCRITAVDISENALIVAGLNAAHHGFDKVTFKKSNWYTRISESFNIIVSNPPYIRSDDEHFQADGIAYEPRLALDGGDDGLNAIRIIISHSVNHLHDGGWLYIEHGYDQGEAVRDLFKQFNFITITTQPDYAGLERITYGRLDKHQCRH